MQAPSNDVLVNTSLGQVLGTAKTSSGKQVKYDAFLAVPYAEKPVRFHVFLFLPPSASRGFDSDVKLRTLFFEGRRGAVPGMHEKSGLLAPSRLVVAVL